MAYWLPFRVQIWRKRCYFGSWLNSNTFDEKETSWFAYKLHNAGGLFPFYAVIKKLGMCVLTATQLRYLPVSFFLLGWWFAKAWAKLNCVLKGSAQTQRVCLFKHSLLQTAETNKTVLHNLQTLAKPLSEITQMRLQLLYKPRTKIIKRCSTNR